MTDPTPTLAKAPILRGLDPEQLQAVLRISTVRTFAQGSVIFKEGNRGEELYLIVKGKVRITRQYPLGGDETLAVLGEGQAFGEMAVFGDDVVRSATAKAVAKCELVFVKRQAFRTLLSENRDLATVILWNVLHQVLDRLRVANDKVMMFVTAPVLS